MSNLDPELRLAFADRGAPLRARDVVPGPDGLDARRRRELRIAEIAIANRFHREGGWAYFLLGIGAFCGWLALFPLAIAGLVGLPVAFVVASVLGTVGYLVSHEVMHGNIFGPQSRWHRLNAYCGWIAMAPLVMAYSMGRIVHMRHHTHINHPENDPDYIDEAPSLWRALLQSWHNRQPGGKGWHHSYKAACEKTGTPEAMSAIHHTLAMQIGYAACLFALAWSGHALVAAACWWLPRHAALTYLRIYLSWAPHHPRAGRTGRYANTRVFGSIWGGVGSAYMGYHLVHHMYPRIPLHLTKPAMLALRPILEARGVDCSQLGRAGDKRAG